MSIKKNTASAAVEAAALSKQAPRDVFDCIAAGIPRNQWERVLNNDEARAWNDWLSQGTKTDCKRIFGIANPLDVIEPLSIAATGLSWLESLFEAIAADPHATPQIRSLAQMGAYLALDHSNCTDAQHEQMRDAVQKGGAQ